MSLHIEQRERDGITIFDLKGPLTLGHGDSELRTKPRVLHQTATDRVVLNLKEVTAIDSTGLGTLVFGLAKLRTWGGLLARAPKSSDLLEYVQQEEERSAIAGITAGAAC
jgi:anti-sigma B factor antagonist